ncbi:MAG: DUF1674 domain-containing protein [Gammaproteobacteria bacterium]|nr:DUF1674 domain-containing protein [Gammaproteobacteria bacterium]
MATDRNQQQDTGAEQGAPDNGDTAGNSSGETPAEIGGPKGPEPTRYGDWEKRGRCIDF